MPDLVGRDLVFRTLLHKADFFRLFALVKIVKISALKEDFAVSASMRRENGFELPQQRTFAAPGRAAEHQKLARSDRQCEVRDCLFFLLRVCKTQMVDCKEFHCLSSFRSRITGVSTSAR